MLFHLRLDIAEIFIKITVPELVYLVVADDLQLEAGNDLAVATASSIQLLDAAGRTVFKQVVSYDTPAVIGTAWGALFCDLGGTACVPVRADGEVRTLHPAGKLITANMNDNGYVALTTEAAGYKAGHGVRRGGRGAVPVVVRDWLRAEGLRQPG